MTRAAQAPQAGPAARDGQGPQVAGATPTRQGQGPTQQVTRRQAAAQAHAVDEAQSGRQAAGTGFEAGPQQSGRQKGARRTNSGAGSWVLRGIQQVTGLFKADARNKAGGGSAPDAVPGVGYGAGASVQVADGMVTDLEDAPPAMSLRSRGPARLAQAAAGRGDSSRHSPGAAGGQQAGIGRQHAGRKRAADAPAAATAAGGGRIQGLAALEYAKQASNRAAAAPGGVPSGSAAVIGDALGCAAAQQAQGGVRGQSPAPFVEAAHSESACPHHSQSSGGQASGSRSGTSKARVSGEQSALHIKHWVHVVLGQRACHFGVTCLCSADPVKAVAVSNSQGAGAASTGNRIMLCHPVAS